MSHRELRHSCLSEGDDLVQSTCASFFHHDMTSNLTRLAPATFGWLMLVLAAAGRKTGDRGCVVVPTCCTQL